MKFVIVEGCSNDLFRNAYHWMLELKEYRKLGAFEKVKKSVFRDKSEKITKTESYRKYICTCPICGEPVRRKDKYCTECGQRLEDEE